MMKAMLLPVVPVKAGTTLFFNADMEAGSLPLQGRRRRGKGDVLRNGCALALALAVIGQAPLARASGFQGTGTVVSGSVTISQGTTSDTIFVGTTEAVIDWRPANTASSGIIDFLPDGHSVLYVDQSASVPLSGYTVLNRILPVDASGNPVTIRPVAFNGTVRTQLGASNFPVGNVWFYSPGGIIAGPTAVFNVGGLVLTANDIIFDTTNGLFGPGGVIRFAGTAGSTASVELQAGSQINIVNPGSYVALVAPHVVQGGTVNINGSAAYVGAEAATITINGGLFDIAISAGTDDANGVVHSGSTNLTPDQGPQRAFVAAVPKNAALTMLLTGNFGYTAAAAATFQDSAVILSAGHDIAFGQSIDTLNGSTAQPAHISVGNSSFAMTVNGRASGAIGVSPTGGGAIQFDDFAGFKAGTSLTVGADDGETINAAFDLDLHAGQAGTGGTATLYANGASGSSTPGQIAVGGMLTIGSDGFGPDAVAAGGNGQDGTGGTSRLLIDGGGVIAGSIFISADGFGGNGFDGGNGTGGDALVSVQDGLLAVATSLNVSADGFGGAGGENQGTGNAGSGGDGFGGSAIWNGTDAEYAFAAVTLEAMGIGGPSGMAISGTPGTVGSGTGGLARLTNADTAISPTGRTMDSLTLNVGGTGASIFSGRAEISDTASFAGGGLAIAGNLDILGAGPAASAASGFYYSGTGDGTRIGGDATVAVGGSSQFDLDGSGIFDVAGILGISGGQNITIRHTNQSATPTPSILAGTIDFGNFGFISGEAGSLISSAGAMNLVSGVGYIDVDRLDSGGTTVLDAANGTIAVITDLQSAGTVQAAGQTISIRSLGTLNVALAAASAGNLSIFADNGMSVTTGTATGALTLGSGLGGISVTDLTGATVGINSFGMASFAGLTQGQTVQVSSGDIAIGAGAQLGTIGTTTQLTLSNSRTTNPTFLGGAGSTAGYSLSAAELTRLFSDDIEIMGTFGGTGQPDVVVDSFTMTSRAGTPGGNLGANGSLSIISAGNIDIVGDVALTGLGVGNQMFFTSDAAVGRSTIAVDATNASISLTDGNGALTGQLNFDAADVFVATPSAVADVLAAADTDAITARLALNDGVVRDGVIRAGTIFADVSGGLYIQNTGASDAFADRRGFAALTDTLDIATRSPTARIVVNGTLVDPTAGTTLTGLAVMPLVRINGVAGATSGNFDPRSTINGCLIASPALCTITVEELPNLPPPYENIEEPLDPGDGGNSGLGLFPTMIVELKDFTPFGYPPLIDEPVTGAGNDDLWMPPCEDDTQDGCAAP